MPLVLRGSAPTYGDHQKLQPCHSQASQGNDHGVRENGSNTQQDEQKDQKKQACASLGGNAATQDDIAIRGSQEAMKDGFEVIPLMLTLPAQMHGIRPDDATHPLFSRLRIPKLVPNSFLGFLHRAGAAKFQKLAPDEKSTRDPRHPKE